MTAVRTAGEWLGGPGIEGDCAAVLPLSAATSAGWLCTLPAHPAGSYHEAWGTSGDRPIKHWLDDVPPERGGSL